MAAERTVEEWRDVIVRERRYVNHKPYSHNIINVALQAIAKKAGREEANKAIRELRLKRLGWNEVAED